MLQARNLINMLQARISINLCVCACVCIYIYIYIYIYIARTHAPTCMHINIYTHVRTGEGLDALLSTLGDGVKQLVSTTDETPTITRARHRELLRKCAAALRRFRTTHFPVDVQVCAFGRVRQGEKCCFTCTQECIYMSRKLLWNMRAVSFQSTLLGRYISLCMPRQMYCS
jgi:hypothetical protein